MSEIRIPDIGDVESVQVIELCAHPGDEVGPDDPLIVIESEKASMEVPAGVAGRIEAMLVKEGDDVVAGTVIAQIATTDPVAAKPDEQAAESTGAAPGSPRGRSATASPSQLDSAKADSAKAASTNADSVNAESIDADSTNADSAAQPDQSASGAAGLVQIDVVVPDVGEAETVTVIEVGAKVGAELSADDLVVVVESDKASMEIPAGQQGKVLEVHVAEGDAVQAGDRLITLEAVSAASDTGKPASAGKPSPGIHTAAEPVTGARGEADANADQRIQISSKLDSAPSPAAASAIVYAGPAVRRMARELGVSLQQVTGTGTRGRIVKEDVQAFVKSKLSSSASAPNTGLPMLPVQDFAKFGQISEQPMGRIREVGAENLRRSWLNVVHVTQHDDADVTDLEAFRQDLKADAQQRQVKLTPLAFIVKACCHLLRSFPTFNASLSQDGKQFILKHYYHIGLAVDTEQGLVVPVLRNANQKGIWELTEEIADLAERARNRKLTPEMLQGASFTISSLGPMGGTGFTPIVNAPEVAILGVSRMATKPQWNGSEFVPRKMLPLSLSYDHRAINGAEAGRFVTELCTLLSDIRRMTL